VLLFGASGRRALRSTVVAVVSAGGLGSTVVPRVALPGVKESIDQEELNETNRDRFV
jgi:tRNA A37 threonylcarbamoyladenosine dehydratase